jgi:predicted AlkP superfamily phosphohydrolase/phosphomutase
MEKIIFLALDGLSWNLINELIENNGLKNFQSIIKSGVSGTLIAEGFLSSPKIFCSIFTGKKVEKHGIKDFYSKEEDLCSEQIWDILNEKGYKIGIYRPLSVWSGKKVNGFCIPNPLLLKKSAYPDNLNFIAELDIKARSEAYSLSFLLKFFWELIKFKFPVGSLIKIVKRGILLFFKKGLQERMHLLKEIELIIHSRLYLKLLKEYQSQFSVFFDYSFDTLSHVYWRDRGEASKYKDVLPKAYQIVDKFIGKANQYAVKNDYHLVICSDHGFERISKEKKRNYRSINILYLLRELNYYYDVYGIYMTESVIFRIRPNSSKSIEEFQKVIEAISCQGRKLFIIKASEKKLVVRINDFFGENKNLKVQLPNGKNLNISSIIDFNPAHTGDHSKDYGVFIIKGSKIKEGLKLREISPYDITPTILSIMDQPIPSEMDGRVLKEVFKDL